MLYIRHRAGIDDSPMYWEAEAFDHPKICPKSVPKPAPNISKWQSHLIRKHIIPNQFPKHHTTEWRWVDLLECQSRIPEKATPIFTDLGTDRGYVPAPFLRARSIPICKCWVWFNQFWSIQEVNHSPQLFPKSRSKVRLGRNQKRCTTWRQKLPNVRF